MIHYPKNITLLLSEIYKKYPEMRRHPEYRFFYLHFGYPEIKNYFFVLTNNIPNTDNDDFLVFINTTSIIFGFDEGVLMKPQDFKKHIAEPMEESAKDLRGSEFKVFGYEVW